MQSLGLDVRRSGIHVTTVCPGTRTPQTTCKYRDEHLWPVEATAREVLRAIDRKKRFHAFPWVAVRQRADAGAARVGCKGGCSSVCWGD